MSIGTPSTPETVNRYQLVALYPPGHQVVFDVWSGISVGDIPEADLDELIQAIADLIENHANWSLGSGSKAYHSAATVTSP